MKPTIFFSHSSKDREKILPIKDFILEKTGSAVQIFMSSDGASIPFGKNWLKEIEEALSNCKLMFVWITPNSSESNWIYFESGFAYSKDIKVVPIGFDGVKLEKMPPPLNILQGFNINSHSSLNNIISIINDEFKLTFPDIFDEKFYNSNVSNSSSEYSSELLEFIQEIKCVFHHKIKNKEEGIDITIKNDWVDVIKNILIDRNITYTNEHSQFYGVGFKIKPVPSGQDIAYPEIYIDPLALNNVWDMLQNINGSIYDVEVEHIVIKIRLNDLYTLPDDHYVLSSRLLNTEVLFDTKYPNIIYKYRNVQFRVDNVTYIQSRYTNVASDDHQLLTLLINKDNKEVIPLISLIKLLERQKIIQQKININGADHKSRADFR